jgi:type VI secretion system protein ImpK
VSAETVLAELATPILRELAELAAAPEKAPPFGDLQGRYHDHITAFASNAGAAGAAVEDTAQARFALTALVDETIMLSEMEARDEWLSQPLQLRYFDEVTGGEEFYHRIDQLRMLRKSAPLEVYWLCLAFGFKGKYGDKKGAERRSVLMETLANEIAQARGVTLAAPLSPQAKAMAKAVVTASSLPLAGPRWWLTPLVTAVVVIGVWLICGWMVGVATTAASLRIGAAS